MLWIRQPDETRIEPVVGYEFGRKDLPGKPMDVSRTTFIVVEVGADSVTVWHKGQTPGRVVGTESKKTVAQGERVVLHVGEKYFPDVKIETFFMLTVDGKVPEPAVPIVETLSEQVVTVVPIVETSPEPAVPIVETSTEPVVPIVEASPEPVVTVVETLPEPVVPISAEDKLSEQVAATAVEILHVESPVQPPPEPPKKARSRKNTRPMRVVPVDMEEVLPEGTWCTTEEREKQREFQIDDEVDARFKDQLMKTAAYTAYMLSSLKKPKFLVKPVEALSLDRDRIPMLEKMRAAKLRSNELDVLDKLHPIGKEAGFHSATLLDRPIVPEPEVDAQWAPYERLDVPEVLGKLLDDEVQPAPKKKMRVIKPKVRVP